MSIQGDHAHLAVSSVASQLGDDFADLSDPGRAHRVAFRFQSATRIDRDFSVDAGAALRRERAPVAFSHESEIFTCDDFRNRKTIVQFRNIDIIRPDAG